MLPVDRSSKVWWLRCVIIFTILGIAVLLGIAFWLISLIMNALLLFTLAILFAYIVYPFIRVLHRILPYSLAMLTAYVGVFGILIFFLYVIILTAIGQLVSFALDLQRYLPTGMNTLQPFIKRISEFGISLDQLQGLGERVINYVLTLLGQLQPILMGVFTLFLNIILVTTLSIYFNVYGPRFIRWVQTRTPIRYQDTLIFFLETLDHTMGGFVRGQLLLASIMSTLMGIGLTLLGVPYAVLLALVVFVFEFIPQIGAYISGAIIVLIAFVTKGWQIGLLVLLLSSFLQAIVDGQILAPRIIGQSVGLNPIISLFALLVGTELFGLPGAFFSAPVAGIIQVFVISGYTSWKRRHPEQFPEEPQNDLQDLPPPSSYD